MGAHWALESRWHKAQFLRSGVVLKISEDKKTLGRDLTEIHCLVNLVAK